MYPDDRPYRIVLVLGGGNALGAYQAGLYEALQQRGMEPDWIVGASIGAINGAIIAGNLPGERIEKLARFWRPAAAANSPGMFGSIIESWRRTMEVTSTLLLGRGGMFGPMGSAAWIGPGDPAARSPALYGTDQLGATLRDLVDFARIAEGAPRFTATAVDVETGDDAVFDSRNAGITAEHVRASGALLTAFPTVEVDGRRYADAGLSANLPLDPVLAAEHDRPVLCIAADLLPLAGREPAGIGETVGRMQDLMFAAQSRRNIDRWKAEYAARRDPPSVTLLRLAYSDQEPEVAGKAMDFSPLSARHRWDAGRRDMSRLIDAIDRGAVPTGTPGLTVIDGTGDLPAQAADLEVQPAS
jgi:NTE family protein